MEPLNLARSIVEALEDKKGEDILLLDLKDIAPVGDYFVICSAPSERQVQAIARHVQSELRQAGNTQLGMEGLEEGNWVLADFADVIFHIFLDSARFYYDLEGFWADADRVSIEK